MSRNKKLRLNQYHHIRLFDKSGQHSKDSYTLSDSFDEPFRMHQPNFMDDALRGLLQVPAMAVDNCMADDITSQLFKLLFLLRVTLQLIQLKVTQIVKIFTGQKDKHLDLIWSH